MENLGLTQNIDFWRGKNVLVTGHTGFKGSWLALCLQHLGSNVVGYSKLAPTEINHYSLIGLENNIHSVIDDIRNLEHLKQVILDYKPEIVFHLAAQSLVRPSYFDPIETYSTNILGTVNLFEAIRATNITKVIINVTSDKCYENKEWIWGYRENEPMGGTDPYSSSKGCVELITRCYQQSYFTHQIFLASARAGNVIGGGDWAEERLVPDIIRAFISKQSVAIRNPYSVRPWQHVLDPLSGYLKLAQALYEKGDKFVGGWNFGPKNNEAKNVTYIVEKLANLWGQSAKWKIQPDEKNLKETNFLRLDCSKAKTELGWQAKWDLNTALAKTVEWYKAYSLGQSMYEHSLKQINEYMNVEKL
ncbi:MAG: CDP-glucose 4,6-dehydratase [Acidobacteria bacterium]|nr:CDP-glucose 4,6-dehydratase [Acidobacteriota bacterium]